MPSTYTPSGQDWAPVNVGKIGGGTGGAKKGVEKRFAAGSNSSAHSGGVMSARKLEETDELKHKKVDKSLSKAIMQARMAKKMTQKDLATAINEKPQVIGEYESGKAIPNGAIIVKIERKLGVKLPRPGKKPAAKKTGAGGVAAGRPGTVRGGPPKRR
jgi:putative transcription factor